MPLTEPIRILSDIHLGHGASRVEDASQLRPLLRGAGTVVFNGDSVEQRFLSDRPQAARHFEALRRACEEEGASPIFLTGNHDPIISTSGHLDLCGGAVLVTHGDIIFHDISPWSPESEVLGEAHSRELAALDSDALRDFEQRLAANKRAALALELHPSTLRSGRPARILTILREAWPPWRPLQIIRCWMVAPGHADQVARVFRPRARFVIIGHTHYSGVWRRGGRVIINTGSFLPLSGLCAVELEEKNLTIRAIHLRRGRYSLGPATARFDVTELTPAPA